MSIQVCHILINRAFLGTSYQTILTYLRPGYLDFTVMGLLTLVPSEAYSETNYCRTKELEVYTMFKDLGRKEIKTPGVYQVCAEPADGFLVGCTLLLQSLLCFAPSRLQLLQSRQLCLL